jgi:hypothetical protein
MPLELKLHPPPPRRPNHPATFGTDQSLPLLTSSQDCASSEINVHLDRLGDSLLDGICPPPNWKIFLRLSMLTSYSSLLSCSSVSPLAFSWQQLSSCLPHFVVAFEHELCPLISHWPNVDVLGGRTRASPLMPWWCLGGSRVPEQVVWVSFLPGRPLKISGVPCSPLIAMFSPSLSIQCPSPWLLCGEPHLFFVSLCVVPPDWHPPLFAAQSPYPLFAIGPLLFTELLLLTCTPLGQKHTPDG